MSTSNSSLLMSHVDVGGEVYQVTGIDSDVNRARLTDPRTGSEHDVDLSEFIDDIESGDVQTVTQEFATENEVVVRRLALAELLDYVGADAELYRLADDVEDAHEELTQTLEQ